MKGALSFSDALDRFQAVIDTCSSDGARVRSHQIFQALRLGSGSSKAPSVRGLLRAASPVVAGFVLAAVSLFSILRLRLSRRGGSGHFQVDVRLAKGGDHRSQAISSLVAPSSCVSFFHSGDLWGSVRSLSMKDSPVYLESIARVLLLILAPVHRFRARRMAVMGSCPYFVCMEGLYGALYLAVARWTFRFIRLQRLLLIDDPRNVALLTKAARSLGIRTVGYMHGKFNRFHVGLLVEPFDVYLVWNEYFAEKIKMLWGGSYPGLVQNVGLTRMGASHWLEKVQKPLHRVLWLDEDETSFEQSRPYLDMLLQDPKVTVIVRLKPGKRRTNDYAELGCIVDDSPGFYASVVLNRIAAVVGCHSTALLEARLFGAVPISVATDLDYGHELVDDGLVLGCTSPEELMRIVYGIISTDGGHGPMAAKFLAPEGDLNVLNGVAASAVLALEGFEMCNG